MDVFEAIRSAEPELWPAFSAKAGEVASLRERDALARGLRLRAATDAVRELAAAGASELGIAGDRDLAATLLAIGILDGFSAVTLYEANLAGPLLIPGCPAVPVLPLAEAASAPALLALDYADEAPAGPGLRRDVAPLRGADIPLAVPAAWRDRYQAALAAELAERERALAGLDPERTILFAGIYAYFNLGKLSRCLQRRGFSTAFLCLNPSNQAHKGGFFDAVLDAGANLEMFYLLLARSRARLVHFQGWLGLHCFAAAAAAVSGPPVVTEFNDLPHYCFTDAEYDRLFGPGAAAAEKRAIGIALAKSAGVCLNYREGSADILLQGYPAAPPLIHLHSHPLDELCADLPPDSEARRSLVFCGTLNPSHYPVPPFGDVQLLGLIREVAAQGVGFHLFLNPYQRKGLRGAFWDYEYLAQAEPLFTLHEGVGPAELPRAIGRLGWGCMLHRFPPGFTVLAPHFDHMLPTKFFSYLEAGLPVVVSRRIKAVAELVQEHGLGLVTGQEDIPRLGELLDAADYDALRGNVRAYRTAHGLDRKLDGLLGLYGSLPSRATGHIPCNSPGRGTGAPIS
ncbi:MAG: hypothetical protein AB1916_01395 [Thermodesulfobacteriota bacterium]